MKLPELSESASPEFADAAACKAWLEHIPLANVAAAQGELVAQLEEFNRFPVAATQRLAVLETLREAVNFVQIEQAKRFSNRALPMSDTEAAVFNVTIGLWDQMRIGYQRCLDAALNRDAGMRAQAALICQRLAAYIGLKMYHHYRAYRQVPAPNWRALHEAYAGAEKLDVADDAVKDFMNRDVHDTSPRIAYARAVLMGICNPNELGQRQIAFISYLLERWASKLEISAKPVDEGEGVEPLIVDLEGDTSPYRGETASPREPR
jgi:cyclic-di-GMP-binding protein